MVTYFQDIYVVQNVHVCQLVQDIGFGITGKKHSPFRLSVSVQVRLSYQTETVFVFPFIFQDRRRKHCERNSTKGNRISSGKLFYLVFAYNRFGILDKPLRFTGTQFIHTARNVNLFNIHNAAQVG